jgi:hypothetical protein
MKKVCAISLAMLILFSGITVNVALHYCGGFIAAKKISLSGEYASCGMPEHDMNKPGINKPHTCANFMSSYTFNNNFVSSGVFSGELAQKVLHAVEIPQVLFAAIPETDLTDLSNRPPGLCIPHDVDLQFICILRI